MAHRVQWLQYNYYNDDQYNSTTAIQWLPLQSIANLIELYDAVVNKS